MPRKRPRDGSSTRPPPLIPGSHAAEPAGPSPESSPSHSEDDPVALVDAPAQVTAPPVTAAPADAEQPAHVEPAAPDPDAQSPTVPDTQTAAATSPEPDQAPADRGDSAPTPSAEPDLLLAVSESEPAVDPQSDAVAAVGEAESDAPVGAPEATSAPAQSKGAEAVPSVDAPSPLAETRTDTGPGAEPPAQAAAARPAAQARAAAPPAVSHVSHAPARLIPGSALIGVVVGLWAVAPNFTGPGLILQDPSVEVIDHVVPGLIVVAASIVALVVAWSASRPQAALFLSGAVVATAGLWMVATHVPMLLQAVQGSAPWGATLFHLAPSVAALWLGLAWTARYWSDWVDPPA